MIVSASRRTDIPAFHSEWFINRLRAGYAMVRNPVSRNVVHRVDLSRSNVDCIVFLTKNPMPMENRLGEVSRMGHMYLFQVTLTPYGRDIEPNVPFKADVNDCCVRIADRIGRDRMAWRYDPVAYRPGMSLEYHRRKFTMLCGEASKWTDRCIFSFLDPYGKLGSDFPLRLPSRAEGMEFVRMAARVADDHGIVLSHCCGDAFGIEGVSGRACLDRETFRSLNIPYELSDNPLRDGCRCVRSIDIGDYDTCLHDCTYCYANRAHRGSRMARVYNPHSEMLYGTVSEDDVVVDVGGRDAYRIDDSSNFPNRR